MLSLVKLLKFPFFFFLICCWFHYSGE